jgi:hypothetical protein
MANVADLGLGRRTSLIGVLMAPTAVGAIRLTTG